MQHTKFLLMLLTTLGNRQTVKSHEFTTSHQADINASLPTMGDSNVMFYLSIGEYQFSQGHIMCKLEIVQAMCITYTILKNTNLKISLKFQAINNKSSVLWDPWIHQYKVYLLEQSTHSRAWHAHTPIKYMLYIYRNYSMNHVL